MLLALAVGGAALALSRLVIPLPESSVTRLAYGLDGDIYLADADGQNPVRIADGAPSGDTGECGSLYGFGPLWSPDGRYLAYRSDHWGDLGAPECPGTVYLSDADGQPVVSFPGTGWLISWSPDSTRVATWVDLYQTIGIYGIDGTRQALLTLPGECAVGGDFDPVWSPGGQSVWIAGCDVPTDGSTPTRVPEGDPRSHPTAAYSPDGTRVAHLGNEVDSNFNAIPLSVVVAEADGSEDRVLIAEGVAYGQEVSLVWSPTGDRIAFHGGPSGEPHPPADEILVVDVASGSVTSLARARAGELIYVLAFSRDGDRILFTRMDATDPDEAFLWSVSADGSDARLLVTGTGWGDWQPVPPGSEPSATPVALPSASSSADRSATAVALPSASASADPSATPRALPSSGEIASGTYFLVNPYQDDDPVRDCSAGCADYQRIVLTLPAGWATSDGLVHKDLGQAGEVAFSIWTVDEVYVDPCYWESSAGEPLDGEAIHTTSGEPHLGMDDQAALLNQVGRTASVPTTMTFAQGSDGWGESVEALKIELTVDPELDLSSCDQAEFRSWTEWDVPDGANSHHAPGQVDVLYLVDVDRRPFVIDASHLPAASDADLAELEAIITSMVVGR